MAFVVWTKKMTAEVRDISIEFLEWAKNRAPMRNTGVLRKAGVETRAGVLVTKRGDSLCAIPPFSS